MAYLWVSLNLFGHVADGPDLAECRRLVAGYLDDFMYHVRVTRNFTCLSCYLRVSRYTFRQPGVARTAVGEDNSEILLAAVRTSLGCEGRQGHNLEDPTE